MSKITIPVWVVNGDNDRMVPTQNSYDLANRIPGAKLTIYPNAGHGAIFQYHEDFVNKALEFLKIEDKMRAIQIDGYKTGDVKVALSQVDMPQVGDNDVLVKVKTAAVNPLDLLIAHGDVKLVVPYNFPLTMETRWLGL